jgi:hypothetical protein
VVAGFSGASNPTDIAWFLTTNLSDINEDLTLAPIKSIKFLACPPNLIRFFYVLVSDFIPLKYHHENS